MSIKSSGIKSNLLISIIKGTLLAVSTTLILILLFALLIRFFDISDSLIFPINQVIKIISLFLGILSLLKNNNEKGFIKGILLGLVYFVLSFIVFSILQGAINFKIENLYDGIITMFMGGLIGIILVNLKRKA